MTNNRTEKNDTSVYTIATTTKPKRIIQMCIPLRKLILKKKHNSNNKTNRTEKNDTSVYTAATT